MSQETAAAMRMFSVGVRQFNRFPGDAWGRKVRWFSDLANLTPIGTAEARRRFETGERVGYATSGGFAAYVEYHPEGLTPNP